MNFPDYYNQIEKIKLYEPLSDILGSCQNGDIEFGFADIVRFSGHGCPTVGGAYLMARIGLKKLFKDEIPTRGTIEIQMNQPKENGVTGVIAAVVAFIIGASDEGGFKGLGGKFSRKNLIKFSQNFEGTIKLTRTDTKESIILEYHPEIVPSNQLSAILLEKILTNTSTAEEKQKFNFIWNERLKTIMINEFSNPNLIIVRTSLQ